MIAKYKDLSMMSLKQERLFEEIEVLPIDLKTKIVDTILSSIMPQDKHIDAIWIKEANKRKLEIENKDISLIDGDDVFQKISKRLNQ